MSDKPMPPGPKVCPNCKRPATCFGRYEAHGDVEFACDGCCGHGNEDGWCEPIPFEPFIGWTDTGFRFATSSGYVTEWEGEVDDLAEDLAATLPHWHRTATAKGDTALVALIEVFATNEGLAWEGA